MGANETIKGIKSELEEVGHKNSGVKKAIDHLDAFLQIPADNPDRILSRIDRLTYAKKQLECNLRERVSVSSSENSNSDTSINNIIELANSGIIILAKKLAAVLCFYNRNSSRIDHQLNKQVFQKESDVFPKYKRMVKNHFDADIETLRGGGKRVKPHSKMTQHYKREISGLKLKDYTSWLLSHGDEYKNKTTAWTFAKFVLDKDLGVTVKPIGKHKSFDWSLSNEKNEFPEHQLKFIGGRVYAAYTVKEEGGNFVAYPGYSQNAAYYHNVYAVHTEYSTKIQIGTQQVMFKSRGLGDIDKIEIPFSLKYAMRHDELFLTEMLDKKYTHARASDFKSIQAAGGLAVTEGKVIAIDNVSGHYEPGWRLLKQAVDKINTNFAFADNALVGLFDKKGPVFFPLKTFLIFAESNFDKSKLNLISKTENPQLPTNINNTSKKHLEDGYWTKKSQKDLEASLDYFKKNQT